MQILILYIKMCFQIRLNTLNDIMCVSLVCASIKQRASVSEYVYTLSLQQEGLLTPNLARKYLNFFLEHKTEYKRNEIRIIFSMIYSKCFVISQSNPVQDAIKKFISIFLLWNMIYCADLSILFLHEAGGIIILHLIFFQLSVKSV